MDNIETNPKLQLAEKLKAANYILVTVGRNPSVDQLASLIGLTLLLNKAGKHAAAVFSGEVPSTLEFLKPEETIEKTTDSLRDFIIALDKSKADKLRYKVEDDVVRIFITPYKTSITKDDLEFSQGDFNVDVVVALGVINQEDLDEVIISHGRILHDATVATVNISSEGDLGSIHWQNPKASSLSEMMTDLARLMGGDMIDNQIATALLTGIVAETDRFSNTHTTSRVMTVAAQLMSAGADQQLIASKLKESHEIGNLDVVKEEEEIPEAPQEPEHKDSLLISHKNSETLEQLDERVKAAEQAEAVEVANESLGEHTGNAIAAGVYAVDHDETTVGPVVAPAPEPTPEVVPEPAQAAPAIGLSYVSEPATEPTLGGTLNATSEQAAEDERREEANDQNKTILSHSYIAAPSGAASPSSATASTGGSSYVLGHDEAVSSEEPENAPVPEQAAEGTFGHELVIEPPTPATAPLLTPTDLGLPMPPPIPDFSAPPAAGSAYALDPAPVPTPQPELLGDILAADPLSAPVAPTPMPNDPGQFKIPGQQ